MQPILRTGDEVVLNEVQRGSICCGDILVFKNAGGHSIIHRVIGLSPLQTKGDNCCNADPPVPEQSPLFKALAYKRNERTIPLCDGAKGLRVFKRNQLRLRMRLFWEKFYRKFIFWILRLNPFKIPCKYLSKSKFTNQTFYYLGKKPIGWFDRNGWHWIGHASLFVEKIPSRENEDE